MFTQVVILEMDRSGAVEHVLEQADDATSPQAMRDALHSFGRDDDLEAIHGAFAYLKRSGRAHTKERGEWYHGPEPFEEMWRTDDSPDDEEGGDDANMDAADVVSAAG